MNFFVVEKYIFFSKYKKYIEIKLIKKEKKEGLLICNY